MTLSAGFAESDITPPPGTRKIGWLVEIVGWRALDPLFARAAVFENGGRRVGVIQLDTLSVRWTTAEDIRGRIAARYGFPPGCILVAATHNHAGPAVANLGDARRDDAYVAWMTERAVEAFGAALARLQPAEAGFGACFDFDVAHNRRVLMRDGTARTHGTFDDPGALCLEGPVDPELAVIAARGADGRLLGSLVNYACHPTHHGPDDVFSAGFPGVLAARLKERGCPATLFLNGAAGNQHTADPVRSGRNLSMEEAGGRLADDAAGVLARMDFRREAVLGAASATLQLPFRAVTDDEARGRAWGAQRFVDPAAYDRQMPALVEKIRARRTQPAQVQALFLDDIALVGIPAEHFAEHGLRLKQAAHPRRALVAGFANGMVGYVPTRRAFEHGGYETTFGEGSRLAPEAGDLLADAAIALIAGGPSA
jgi:hypothetical protein